MHFDIKCMRLEFLILGMNVGGIEFGESDTPIILSTAKFNFMPIFLAIQYTYQLMLVGTIARIYAG